MTKTAKWGFLTPFCPLVELLTGSYTDFPNSLRYDPLENTLEELRDQDATLRQAMVRLADADLIIAG